MKTNLTTNNGTALQPISEKLLTDLLAWISANRDCFGLNCADYQFWLELDMRIREDAILSALNSSKTSTNVPIAF